MVGKKFNKLTVIEYAYTKKHKYYKCICDCGNLRIVKGTQLRTGRTKSCGCILKEIMPKINKRIHSGNNHNRKHGYSSIDGNRNKLTPTYISWQRMKQRCLNPNNKFFKNYGGKGIKVHPKWLEFEGFLEDLGERPKDTTLGRFMDLGNYEPGNCRWMTRKEQDQEARKKKEFLKLNYVSV